MTITTVKPAWPGRRAPLAAAAAALLLAPPCHADWRVVPTFGVTETYSDNVLLQPDALAQSQFITEYTPGLALLGSGRRYKVAASGQWRYFDYRDDPLPKTVDSMVSYTFAGQGELVEDLLFIEASGSATPRAVSAFGPPLTNNLYSLGNRTQIETWRVSPYIEQRLGRTAKASLRYTRDFVDAGELDNFGKTLGHSIDASLASGTAYRNLGWGLNFRRQLLENEKSGDSSSTTVVSNLRYALNPRLALTATAGYDDFDYQALGGRTAGRSWSAGIDWQPSLRTMLKASFGRHYFGKTGALDATHRSRHTVWNINYDDEVTTTRSQFLLPSAIDTAAMLDQLLRTSIPDAALRQQAVAAYIRDTGLPPTLADSVNFLTNRYVRQKRLQATTMFNLAHSTGTFMLYRTERIALSDQRSDSDLLGSQLASLNDNVRQVGASFTYAYRLNSRSSLIAGLYASRSLSRTTGYENDSRQYRIGFNREIGKHLRAALELRSQRGGIGINAGDYRENAVSASLSAQL